MTPRRRGPRRSAHPWPPRPSTRPASPTARRCRAATPSRSRSSATAPPAKTTSTTRLGRDPIARLEAYLRGTGALDDESVERFGAEAEKAAAELRTRMTAEPQVDPLSLFEHVYAVPTPQLVEQREQVRAELAAGDA